MGARRCGCASYGRRDVRSSVLRRAERPRARAPTRSGGALERRGAEALGERALDRGRRDGAYRLLGRPGARPVGQGRTRRALLASDDEPEDVAWINDGMRPLLHAIAPREAARLALRIAEETDRRVASISPARMWPEDPKSPLNPLRAAHRAEHLAEIEAALRG